MGYIECEGTGGMGTDGQWAVGGKRQALGMLFRLLPSVYCLLST